MSEDEMIGDVVNLGNDYEITIKHLAETIIQTFDTDSEITYEPLPEDDPSRRRPDLTKAQRLLDFEPEVGLEAGLRKTFEYFEGEVKY